MDRPRGSAKALGFIKEVMWAVAIAGMVAGIGRFVHGLGASTNMMDALPWGWWKVFNMVAGAALATSGFVVAAIIYIFQAERYRPVARLSVLVGFLGYGSSLSALLFDIGLPHRGWHPFFMWNPHSFLFEVFWCVSIYWGITALELLPIVTERFRLHRVTHWLHEKMLPFVVLGITLSTMHHSSLGSLFMMSPTRLHPLWYSLWIPPEFFVSAMGAGLSTIVLLVLITSWLYGHARDQQVINRLALASAILLGLYLVIKAADFTVNRKWDFVFGSEMSWESLVFWVEITLQAIVPVTLLSLPSLRKSALGLSVATSSAFVGLIINRIDTGIVGYFRTSHAIYVPNSSELVLSFGLLSAAGLVFFFLIEKFWVLDEPKMVHGEQDEDEEEAHVPAVDPWTREELLSLLTGPGAMRVLRITVVFIPLAVLVLHDQATGAFEPIHQPVSQAVLAADPMRTILRMDANNNGMFTTFNHKKHQVEFQKVYEIAEKDTCKKCHHLNLPHDNNTSCRRCHRDMELDTELFAMDKHRNRFESEADYEKFLTVNLDSRAESYTACMGCHEKTMAGLTEYAKKGFSHRAPGFENAMHGSCLTCHRQREREKKEDPASPKSRGNCLFCHRDWADEGLFKKDAAMAHRKEATDHDRLVQPNR